MLLKRKYFKSNKEEYSFSTVQQSIYLYIYKHNYPEIIFRFPSPKKTIIGYEVALAEILYYPFYEGIDSTEQENYPRVQKVTFPYKGELILNKEAEIFTEFLKRELQSLIQQTRNPTKKRRYSFKEPKIKIQISEVFEILINEWFSDTFINAIFLVKQKHLTSFTSYDHGFLKLEVLKTSQTNMKIPFYKSLTAKFREIKQIENKHYFFEFQSSVLFQDNIDYTDVEKLGIVMPQLLSMNEFFFECLISMFHEFQEEEERRKDRKKREWERMRIKQTLLENLKKMGLQPNLPDIKSPQIEIIDEPIKIDPLDIKLEQILGKKKIAKEEEQSKDSQVETSQIKERQQNHFQNLPQKRQENPGEYQEEEFKRKSQPRKNQKIDLANIKVIRSFTSEIIDDDFEQTTKKRFITKAQFDKLVKFHEKIIGKRYQKELKALQLKNQVEGKEVEAKLEKKQELIYVGVKENKNKFGAKSLNKNIQKNSTPYVFDYFSFHQDTIMLDKKEEGADGEFMQFPEENNEIYKNPFNSDSRNFETDSIVIPGIQQISIIEKKGKERHSKIKAIEFMYENSNAEDELSERDEDFNIDESEYD